jgi:tRNA(fMet)-specific endonuclease VapC
MIYLLDTDHLSPLGHKDSPHAPFIRRHIVELPPDDTVGTTVVNFEEQMRGWMSLLRQARSFSAEVQVYARLLAHLDAFRRMPVMPFDDAAAAQAQSLRAQRLSLGTMDLKIAAIALTRNAVLVTRNRIDFAKIPGLSIEDWSRES